jgi:hypothetical protein
VINYGHLASQREVPYILLMTNKLPTKSRFNKRRCSKAIKYSFAFCVVDDARERGTFD